VELKFSNTRNYSSTWKNVKCCVPVESVLNPLMFSVYIDDVPCSVDNISNVIMYTDNKSILTADICNKELSRKSREVLYKNLTFFRSVI
jgi:hypothetical protein